MYNLACLYEGKFRADMEKDFEDKFPGLHPNIKIKFQNDPEGRQKAWADCVRIGGGLYEDFSVYLGKFYGNCGIASISGIAVGKPDKGIGTWLLGWCEKMLGEMGFTIVIGTTNDFQSKMDKLLKKAAWEEVPALSFKNRRSARNITFWRKHLNEAKDKVPGYQFQDGAVLV